MGYCGRAFVDCVAFMRYFRERPNEEKGRDKGGLWRKKHGKIEE